MPIKQEHFVCSYNHLSCLYWLEENAGNKVRELTTKINIQMQVSVTSRKIRMWHPFASLFAFTWPRAITDYLTALYANKLDTDTLFFHTDKTQQHGKWSVTKMQKRDLSVAIRPSRFKSNPCFWNWNRVRGVFKWPRFKKSENGRKVSATFLLSLSQRASV